MSSWSPPTGNASAQKVPAWKRLGLRLKQSAPGGQNATHPTATNTAAAPATSLPRNSEPASAKRKPSGPLASENSAKKARRDSQPETQAQHTPSKKPKSVSFAGETTTESPAVAAPAPSDRRPATPNKNKANQQTTTTTTTKKKKKAGGAAAAATPAKQQQKTGKQGPVNLEPALSYLRQWHGSRANWKFNKNHQTRLLEQVFADETTIPAVDIDVFYAYIRGLQGGVRARLRELARGVVARDAELGVDGFPLPPGGGKQDKERKDARDRKQREYEEVVAGFLAQGGEEEEGKMAEGGGKRRFEEVDYVLRTADMEMQRRVVKRMRAETVLQELADGGDRDGAATTAAAKEVDNDNDDDDKKRLQLNDGGSQQRVKRRRLRKSRTAAADDDDTSSSSSSSSESDSDDSDSSSDSSSDDGDAPAANNEGTAGAKGGRRNGVANAATAAAGGTSSSSSSSSDSESGSDSDSDSSSSEDD